MPRRLLTLGFLLFARFSRSLERISPRLSDLLLEITESAYNVQRQSMIGRQAVTLRVGETRFRLCLAGGRAVADEYVSLAAKGEVYEPVATACLTRLLRRLPDPTFVDVGAYVGYFTCYAAALLRDRRPVFAVESNPIFCEAIQQAAALNGFQRVRVLQAALADRAGTVTIDDTAVLPGDEPGPGRRIVQAIAFDDLCAREEIAPTVLKIDVHGAEGRVLRGMARVFRESVQVVLLELHARSSYRPHSPDLNRLELLDLLEQLGFSLFHVAGHRKERNSGMATYLEQGRFAYVPVTRQTRQFLLFDRPLDVLILACKNADPEAILGPSVPVSTAVG